VARATLFFLKSRISGPTEVVPFPISPSAT